MSLGHEREKNPKLKQKNEAWGLECTNHATRLKALSVVSRTPGKQAIEAVPKSLIAVTEDPWASFGVSLNPGSHKPSSHEAKAGNKPTLKPKGLNFEAPERLNFEAPERLNPPKLSRLQSPERALERALSFREISRLGRFQSYPA